MTLLVLILASHFNIAIVIVTNIDTRWLSQLGTQSVHLLMRYLYQDEWDNMCRVNCTGAEQRIAADQPADIRYIFQLEQQNWHR